MRSASPRPRVTTWLWAERSLFTLFLLAAALNLLHLHVVFLTTHLADLVVPAWLYIVARGLSRPSGPRGLIQFVGRTPELAATSLFLASTITEISQIYWPRGAFAGTFDPLDLLAYAVGLGIVYAFDRKQMNASLSAAGVRFANGGREV